MEYDFFLVFISAKEGKLWIGGTDQKKENRELLLFLNRTTFCNRRMILYRIDTASLHDHLTRDIVDKRSVINGQQNSFP
jgi:hypothetical protein